jgi:hypothetical protein
MDEQAQARIQETTRRAQDNVRRTAHEAVNAADEVARLGAETVAVWTRINQEVWRDVLDLGASTARESTQLATRLQQSNVDAWREFQGRAFRWYTIWPEIFRDPLRGYQRALEESMEAARRSIHVSREHSEAVTRSLQQLQASAEETTRTVQRSFQSAASRLQEVAQRTERLHAA